MPKKLVKLSKNILFAPFLIYLYNLIASPLGLIVPINIMTILIVGFLGFYGLITLLLFYLIMF